MTNQNQEKKLYCLNADGLSEWFIARSKNEALDCATNIWGSYCLLEYFKDYLSDRPTDLKIETCLDEFIEYFVQEEPYDRNFTYTHEDGAEETKTVKEWIKNSKECPSFFASEEF